MGTLPSLHETASSHGCENLPSWLEQMHLWSLKPHHILVIDHPVKAEEGKNKMWEQVVSCGERGLVPAVLFIYIEWQMEFLSESVG